MTADTLSLLLIEDDEGDALLVQKLLTLHLRAPLRVTHVKRLDQGLGALNQNSFDVAMMDLGLPDSQGLDTFLKVQEKAPHLPFIVLTGRDDDELGVLAVQNGAQDYLVKGQVTGSLVARAIQYAIERKKLLMQLERSLKEIKVLQGMLPICMHCKKIRDDQGVWTQMEAYISTHSEAEFSHSVCSECASKFYSEYLGKEG